MKQYIKNRFRERKRQIGLMSFLTVFVVSVTFLGLAIPKIMAGDTQVSDLILQGESKEQSIALTVRDEHPEDTKIVIPLPEGITYISNSNPNIGVTYDELNKQLVIDWVEGEEKQVELQLEAEQKGQYDFTARTVRDGEPVTSSMIHILITISNDQDEISNSTIEEDPNFINQKKNGTAQDSTEENSIDLENSSNISSTGNNVKDDVESIDSWMPDKKLQAAVSQQLKIQPESLTQNDMLSLTSLNAAVLGISSLKGLEYAVNLKGDVSFNFNSISDISPLYATKISYLRLASNRIEDVSQFLNMPYLNTLVVANNRIRDLSSLSGSRITTIIAKDQTITLNPQEVVENQIVSIVSQVSRPGGDRVAGFETSLGGSYESNSDILSWQLNGSPQNVSATWNDNAWIKSHYNAKNVSSAGFSGKIIQPLTYLAAPVTVNYVDGLGKVIADEEILQGKVGDQYDSVQKDIDGYKFKKVEGNRSGKFTHQPQTVTYVYTTDTLRFYSVPEELEFKQTKIGNRTQTIERKDSSWKMVVEDNRLNKGTWRVTASLAEQFKDSSGNPLENNILIFSKGNHPEQWITSGSDIGVFDGSSSEDKELYDVSWTQNEGPLLHVAPGTVKVGKYTGVINWSLVDAPV